MEVYVFIKNSPNPILGAITFCQLETFVCIGVVLHSMQKPGGSYCLRRSAHELPLVVTFLQLMFKQTSFQTVNAVITNSNIQDLSAHLLT